MSDKATYCPKKREIMLNRTKEYCENNQEKLRE